MIETSKECSKCTHYREVDGKPFCAFLSGNGPQYGEDCIAFIEAEPESEVKMTYKRIQDLKKMYEEAEISSTNREWNIFKVILNNDFPALVKYIEDLQRRLEAVSEFVGDEIR